MREFIIDFTADVPIVPGTVIGRQGENNATALKIKIPDEMLNNEAVELISLAAQIGAGYVARSELIAKAETVTVKLDSRMTAVNSLSIQLEGYDSTKSLLVKSAKIDNLIFEKSVTGETHELEGNAGVIADIAANTSARHTHENAETLNKLGDNNGNLTYDGKTVGGRQTASVQINISDLLLDSPISAATNIYLNSTNQIPENSEIASVELNNGTIESPNWIDLRGMDALYPYNPYSVNFHKLNYSNALDAYFLASITFFSIDKNALISSLDNYGISQIRVTYYI